MIVALAVWRQFAMAGFWSVFGLGVLSFAVRGVIEELRAGKSAVAQLKDSDGGSFVMFGLMGVGPVAIGVHYLVLALS